MLELIKQTWSEWKSLRAWQQVLLLVPLIILSIIVILYLFFPAKINKLEEALIQKNKKTVEKHIKTIEKKEKKVDKEIKEVQEERSEIKKEIEERQNEAENLIKDIDDADGDFDSLVNLHKKLNSRRDPK